MGKNLRERAVGNSGLFAAATEAAGELDAGLGHAGPNASKKLGNGAALRLLEANGVGSFNGLGGALVIGSLC